MARLAIVFSVLAIAAFAAGNVWAVPTWGIQPDNYFNMDGVYPNITTPQDSGGTPSPTDKQDGYVWLKTGSASPQLFSGSSLTVAVYYQNASNGYTFLETENANCSAYPGQFLSVGPIGTWGQYLEWGGGNNIAIDDPNFLVTGSETIDTKDLEDTYVTWQQGTFYLQMWTGGYSSYAAAYADSAKGVAGAYVAQTAPFPIDLGPGGEQPIDYVNEMMYMPAVVLAHGLDGDANLDGKVDINDLTIVLAHYDQTGQTWAQGEFTGDGTVDINDLTIVLAHYGQTAGASAGGISAVPEPSTLLLTAAGLLGLLACAWRIRK